MNDTLLQNIEALMKEGVKGRVLAEKYSAIIDSLISGIFTSISGGSNLLLLATGGYGRRELAPYSDIDIMFFAENRTDTDAAEKILYRLWDEKLEISHAFRTGRECIKEAFNDIKTRTSLLEARYLAGSRDLYQTFRNDVYPAVAYKKQREFVRDRLKEMSKSHMSSGDSVYLLEPQIKEGEGGLRDLHTVYWLSKVAFRYDKFSDLSKLLSQNDYKRLLNAYDFLIQVRYCLHLESKRRNDILSFEFQRAVSERLGFRDSKKFSAPERMMRYYYLKSKSIKEISRNIMVSCSNQYIPIFRDFSVKKITSDFSISGGKIIAKPSDLFSLKPDKIIEAFYHFSRTGKKISDVMSESIRSNLLKIDRIRKSLPAISFFLGILNSQRVYETINEMYDIGVLGRFIPEFGALRALVLHEPYHLYTVDIHTLVAMRNVENLRHSQQNNLSELTNIINKIEDITLLYMAVLLHDIGKAVGRHHQEEGYKRLKNVMERFRLENRKRLMIEFLVRNHVLMSKIALTREIGDSEVLAEFADAVGDMEHLNMLYLMTYADMSAVNPKFWTSWKAHLLRELYLNTAAYFSGVRDDNENYLKQYGEIYSEREKNISAFIEEMPDRYLISTTRSRLRKDYELVIEAKKTGFAVRIDKSDDSIMEITICANDSPGLFSRIIGFLSSKKLNIVHGRIFTGKRGIVIDKISVSDWKDLWWDGFLQDLSTGLKDAVLEKKTIEIVRQKIERNNLFDNFIEIDNETSQEFSLIEVFARDRFGLLYDISEVLRNNGVDIISARVNTEAGLAQDIFYIQRDKGKINDHNVHDILKELWAIL